MYGVSAEITRCVEDGQPPIVECQFSDATGRVWRFLEKVPVVTTENLDSSSAYPQTGVIACAILSRRTDAKGRAVVDIDTDKPWAIRSIEDESRFTVLADAVVEFDFAA